MPACLAVDHQAQSEIQEAVISWVFICSWKGPALRGMGLSTTSQTAQPEAIHSFVVVLKVKRHRPCCADLLSRFSRCSLLFIGFLRLCSGFLAPWARG